jgi:serine/threonine protein kinase
MTFRPDILCPRCRRINARRASSCRYCNQALGFVDGNNCYYLTRVIKTGGQAVIFEAIDENSNRTYAIKEIVLPLDPDRALDAFQRCAIEARLLATLAHPGIPQFYSCIIENGRVYIVMDLIRGTDLEDLLRSKGQLSERDVLSVANQACDILHYLHTLPSPVIFRDVKPSNIMIDAEDFVTMIDFGIARFTNNQRGSIMGTPGYAPPEQYRGDVSVASDIYALGATMHHLLTGRDPRGQKPFTFLSVRDLAPHVSPLTANVVTHALHIEPEARFATALEMRNAIRAVIRSEETNILPVIRDTSPIPMRTPSAELTTVNLPSTVVETRQIMPTSQPLVPTKELGFAPPLAHVTVTLAPPSLPALPAIPLAPPPARGNPWRWLITFIIVVTILIGSVWYIRFGQYLLVPTIPQTITVPFEVTVAPDADINASFYAAADAYVRETYGTRMRIVATPQFDNRPPEVVAQQTDGSTQYRGVLVIDIAP